MVQNRISEFKKLFYAKTGTNYVFQTGEQFLKDQSRDLCFMQKLEQIMFFKQASNS